MRGEAQVFTKKARDGKSSLVGEAAALRWLAEPMASGGLKAAHVVSVDERKLVEEAVICAEPTRAAAERAGRALAITHAAGAAHWGAPPAGWHGSYLISYSSTPTVRYRGAATTWGSFFARYRIRHYLRDLHARRVLAYRDEVLVEQVATRLDHGDFDAPQPALVGDAGHEVARLHGDLWAGNLLWDSDPTNKTGAVLIDPMAHGGHAETDLAMLALFGCAHLDVILAAYDEVSPLADGWRERVGLHQLAPLLHHCILFGASYVPQTLEVARRYA